MYRKDEAAMGNLVCTVFNVDHGLCAFVQSPHGYGLLLDCGSRTCFSPVKWIRRHYNAGKGNITYFEGRRIAKCIISHLHADHFADVGSMRQQEDQPKLLLRDKQTLKFIDEKIAEGATTGEQRRRLKTLEAFKTFSDRYTEDVEDDVDWGFDTFTAVQISYAAAQNASDEREKIINNRSFLVVIGFAGKKILFPGDIEVPGWEQALRLDNVQEMLRDTTFFVASHHGHKSGFTKKILDYAGIPDIYIISAKRGDEDFDSSYSDPANSRGYTIAGESGKSRTVSTKCRGRSIQVEIRGDGSTEVRLVLVSDNLSNDQARMRAKHTERSLPGNLGA